MDELLFYGGMTAAVVFLFLALLCWAILKIRKLRIQAQLDEEYGKEEIYR